MGTGLLLPAPPGATLKNTHVFSNQYVLYPTPFWILLGPRRRLYWTLMEIFFLGRHDWLHHWLVVSNSTNHSQVGKCDCRCQPSGPIVGSSSNHPCPKIVHEHPSARHPITYLSRDSKSFKILFQEPRREREREREPPLFCEVT